MENATIILKNDDIHQKVEVMELLANLDLEYNVAKELINNIEKDGESIILYCNYSDIIFKYKPYLDEGCFDYLILI